MMMKLLSSCLTLFGMATLIEPIAGEVSSLIASLHLAF